MQNNYLSHSPAPLSCTEQKMSVVLAVIGVIVIAAVTGITWWWSAIVSAIRISYALRDLPRHHKEHWLFGNLPYVVSQ